jgi:hypothetical protein
MAQISESSSASFCEICGFLFAWTALRERRKASEKGKRR